MTVASGIIQTEINRKAMPPHSNMPSGATMRSRLSFGRFDEIFLEKSWHWLRDPEIKWLTMTPDFTREEQLRLVCPAARKDRLFDLGSFLRWDSHRGHGIETHYTGRG